MWKILSCSSKWGSSRLDHVRYISATSTLEKSHYDVLGVTPKATQTDIKAAYYKMSMMYHPDKNKESDAVQIFRDITTAYEVLGNYKLRKLYDRGLLHTVEVEHPTHDHKNPEDSFYQSREFRRRTPSSSGKTPIYDFDEWARQHYGHSFARRANAKYRWEKGSKSKVTSRGNQQTEITISAILVTFMALLIVANHFSNYDVDRTEESSSEDSGTLES